MRCFYNAYGNFGCGVLYRNFVGQGCYKETICSLLAIKHMYAIINQNTEALLDSINPTADIDPYVWLLGELPIVNVAQHQEFQRVYRRYWQLNPARLSEGYLTAYFGHLEQLKGQPEYVTVEAVARHLLPIPTHGNGRQSLQFSFASKLVHMLNPEQPVYDSMVERFFFLPTGRTNETTEQKIARLLISYEFLHAEYGRVLEQALLAQAIARFRERFLVNAAYTDRKIIDTLIWKFVGFLKAGALRNGVVVYG